MRRSTAGSTPPAPTRIPTVPWTTRAFSFAIAGAAGARYSGQCTLTTAGADEIVELAGVVPRHEELSAEAVACRIASAGRITIELTHKRGRSRATINGGSAHLAVR